MKTVYLHIGPHKTGTTTIQESLYAEQEKLLRDGIAIPAIGQPFPGNIAQHNLAWELAGDRSVGGNEGSWEDLGQMIRQSPHKKFILSSEEFSRVHREGIYAIKDHLAGFDVKVIVYLRRQDKIMQSFWAEMLKAGNHPEFFYTFEEWLKKTDYQFINANYQKMLWRWKKVFGIENLVVRVLEPGQLRGALFHDFLNACDVSKPEKYPLYSDTNISPGIRELVLIRELKKRLSKTIDGHASVKLLYLVRRYAELHGWNDEKVNLIGMDLFQRIMGYYQESNRAVALEYFGRDELFLETFQEKEITRFEINDFTPGELLDFFGFVIGKMLQKND